MSKYSHVIRKVYSRERAELDKPTNKRKIVGYKASIYEVDGKLRNHIRSENHPTENAADDWARTEIALIKKGVDSGTVTAAGAGMKFGELVKQYLDDDDRLGGLNQNKKHQNSVWWWKERLGDMFLAEIRTSVVKKFHTEYKSGSCQAYSRKEGGLVDTGRPRSPATINRHLAVLKRVYRYARLVGDDNGDPLVEFSPTDNIRMEAEDNIRARNLTDEELGKVLDKAREMSGAEDGWPKLYCFVLGLFRTGARSSEWLNVRWENVDLKKRTAFIGKAKNKDLKTLTLTPDLITELERIQGGVRQISGLVFPRDANPAKPYSIRRRMEALRTAAGLSADRDSDDYWRWHDSRHVVAGQLLGEGESLIKVGEVLGHRSEQSTKRYSHLAVEDKKKTTDKLTGRGVKNADEK